MHAGAIEDEDEESEVDDDLIRDEIESAQNREKEEEELKEAAEVPIEQLLEEWKAMVKKDEDQVLTGYALFSHLVSPRRPKMERKNPQTNETEKT